MLDVDANVWLHSMCVTRVLASRHLLLRVSTLCQLPAATCTTVRPCPGESNKGVTLPPTAGCWAATSLPCVHSTLRYFLFWINGMVPPPPSTSSQPLKMITGRYCHRFEPEAWVCVDSCIQTLLSPLCWWRPGRVPGCATCHHRSPPLASLRTPGHASFTIFYLILNTFFISYKL